MSWPLPDSSTSIFLSQSFPSFSLSHTEGKEGGTEELKGRIQGTHTVRALTSVLSLGCLPRWRERAFP